MTRRIALLSPYSGRNLGDGAVHVATIANLRALDPDVELIGLTVDTNAMLRLHGLSSVTQTGMHGPFYYLDANHPDARPRQPEKKRKSLRAAGAAPASAAAPQRRSLKSRIPVVGPVVRSLRESWKWLLRWRHEPAHFMRSLSLARKVDLIVAIGGGQFDEQWGGAWGHPYTLYRWAMIANFAGKPFAMASVGVGILESKRGRDLVRRACAAAVYRSFRDPGSKAECMAWDFVRNDAVVPDIVLSLPERMVPAHTPGPKRRVGVSPMIFGREGIWPHERQGTYERYLGVLAEFVVWLMERGDEVVFFTSCVDDYTAVEELWERVQALRPDLAGNPSPLLPSDTVEDVMRSLAGVDLAVTSRLHATVLAHRSGCPVTAIAFERKVNAAMEFFAHHEYILDIFTVELEPLKQTYLKLAENGDALRAQIVRDIQAANIEIQKQNALILQLAGGKS